MGQAPDLELSDDLLELQQLLRAEWPARTAALHASGVPLMEDDDPDDPADDPADDPDDDPADDPHDPDDRTFDAGYVRKLREEAARHRREAREAQARVKEFEDKDKSDAQLLEERAATAEQRAATAEGALMRTRVALKKGLTESQAKRLIGDTEEELEADADELLASFKPDDDDPAGPDPLRRTPRERLRPGAVPSSEPEETDPAKLAASVPRMFP